MLASACASTSTSKCPVAEPVAKPAPTAREVRRAQRAEARAAYARKEWARCAALFEQAHDGYGAASCAARAGVIDGAFAQLTKAIDGGLRDVDLERDPDLEALRGDARWASAMQRFAAQAEAHRRTLDAELTQLFEADQADRAPRQEAIDWTVVRPRDQARRQRVDEILQAAAQRTLAADDYYHAAFVYQHGETPVEIQRAHDLAVRAVEVDPDHEQARWLAAASEDRKLMYEHKAQKWGTQYKKIDGAWLVWPVDPAITDAQRAAWEVPPLVEAEARAAQMNARAAAAR